MVCYRSNRKLIMTDDFVRYFIIATRKATDTSGNAQWSRKFNNLFPHPLTRHFLQQLKFQYLWILGRVLSTRDVALQHKRCFMFIPYDQHSLCPSCLYKVIRFLAVLFINMRRTWFYSTYSPTLLKAIEKNINHKENFHK